ncbi:MAG: threonine/serine exporter family protein, partial [Clostridia bacterium]|nr:threonine/serine exporter family protein [Clostridia bacterium]
MEKHAYYERVLTFALDFGKKLLESGYEVTKSQDTMERLCRHYGDLETNFFVIPQEINATIKFEENIYISQMREITNSSINLFMIEKLNALSRKICKENIP